MFNDLLVSYDKVSLESDDIDVSYSEISRDIIEVANKSSPQKKPFEVSIRQDMFGGMIRVNRLSRTRQSNLKPWLQNKTEYNHSEMKKGKITCKIGETPERRGGAHMGISERIDTILN